MLSMIVSTLTHSHSCRHCDETWSCTECYDPDTYDIVRHGCEPQQKYRVRMAVIMALSVQKCRYGCNRPCSHDKTGPKRVKACQSGDCGECKRCYGFLQQWKSMT